MGAEKARDHPIYDLLHLLPNAETTAYDFWLMYIYNLMLTPAAYAYVARDGGARIAALYNLPSKYCRMKRNRQTGERYVEYENSEIKRTIYPQNLMYTPGARMSDVDNPLDPIVLAGKVLRLTSNLNEFADNYFANGAQASGTVTLATAAKEEVFKQFIKDFTATYAGVSNANKIMFLNGNSKFEKVSNNPNDSQALESRQSQIYEICRVMGVTPFKVFEYGRATYNNMEQVNIEFVQETIDPMVVRLEQTMSRDLLLPAERRLMYPKFNVDGLLRGDTAARTAYFNTMRQNGVMNANEIREKENMNRIAESEGGNAYLCNGNMISLKTAMTNVPKGQQKGGSS
jgi:HK97 family phage portal protein